MSDRLCIEARLVITSLVIGLLPSCSSWQEVASREDWSLLIKPGGKIDSKRFEEMLDPAVAAVEAALGPFEGPVRIHAWDGGVDLDSGTRGRIGTGADSGLIESNLGPARVRGFHVKRDAFDPGGVFLGEPAPGTAIHELVHARLAELSPTPPLWFEEGLAMLLADGQMVFPPDGLPYWVRDGLCAWPRSVLADNLPSDAALASVLELKSGDEHSVEENLLVHFIGWALVFDLSNHEPNASWQTWLATFDAAPSTARARLERSIERGTLLTWLHKQFSDPEPGVRAAAARGTWRGADSSSLQLISSALRSETDPEVRATLAINLLAAAGEGRFAGMGRWNGLRLPLTVLESLDFGTPADRAAAARLFAGYRGEAPRGTIEAAFRDLEAYWQE